MITFVIFASGLKYVGVPTTALGVILAAVALAALAIWLVRSRPWHRGAAAAAAQASPATASATAIAAQAAAVPSAPDQVPDPGTAALNGHGNGSTAPPPLSGESPIPARVTVPRNGPPPPEPR